MKYLKTLVATAEPEERLRTLSLLHRFGLETTVFTSGKEVIDQFMPGHYRLVLMGDSLSDLDVFDVATAIRNREAASDTAFIPAHLAACFEEIDIGLRVQSFAFDINDCLPRPALDDHLPLLLRRITQLHLNLSDPSPRPSGPPVCQETIQGLAGGHTTASPLPTLINLFLMNTPSLLRRFNEAISRHDSRMIRTLARKIQGACLSFGAHRVIRLCSEILEAERRHQSPVGFMLLLNEEFTQLVSRLHHLRQEAAEHSSSTAPLPVVTPLP